MRLAATSRTGGGCNWMTVPPPALAPAQLVIQVVSTSAHAELLASQQLWPPPTLVTMRESEGWLRLTTVLAAS